MSLLSNGLAGMTLQALNGSDPGSDKWVKTHMDEHLK